LMSDGTVEVEAAASDMGPGTYTSLTQVAADALGLRPANIRVRIGQSNFPTTPPHGGSMTMASVGSAVHDACSALRSEMVSRATANPRSPLNGAQMSSLDVEDGWVTLQSDTSRRQHYVEILAQAGGTPIEVSRTSQSGDEVKQYSMHSFGALFVEVGVDAELATVTIRRTVGAYGVGRVINPRLAHSQAIGGMIGGIGMALMEGTVLDRRDGRPVNASMADYLVPVNLDISGTLEAHFVEENDSKVNPLGAKGLGELALIGMAPAIANAVYHATGRRVRNLPIRIESLL
jgi:xanthine dehydrogenase YagR molybdenum-binding subunit